MKKAYTIDFAELKAKVNIEDVIKWLGIELKPSGQSLRGMCPLCEKSDRCFSVTPSKGLWNCFGCSQGGDVIKLVALMRKLLPKQAAHELARQFVSSQPARNEKPKDISNIKDYLIPDHESLVALGLEKETSLHFGAGFKPKGVLSWRLAIPIMKYGILMGYCGRAVKKGQEPLLAFPKDFMVTGAIFNAEHITEGPLAFTDDPLKAMIAYQMGVQAVASFGPPNRAFLKDLVELMEEKGIEDISIL